MLKYLKAKNKKQKKICYKKIIYHKKDSGAQWPSQDMGRAGFSIKMASGDTYEKPSINKLKELLNSLDEDNFFLILNGKDGFLRASVLD